MLRRFYAPGPDREVAGVDAQAEILGLAVALLDLLWIHPLLSLLGSTRPDGQPRVALWPLVLLVLLARGVVWALERRRAGAAIYNVVVGVAALASIGAVLWLEFYAAEPITGPGGLLAGLRAQGLIAVLLAGLLLWWRTLQGEVLELGRVYTRFRSILLTYLVYAGIAWLWHAPALTPVLTRDSFGVFLAGLSAFALARSRMEGDRSHQLLSTRWFVFSLSLIAVVLALGLLIGSLFAGDVMTALFNPLLTAVGLLGVVLVFVVEAITWVLFMLINFLFGWIHLTPAQSSQLPVPPESLGSQAQRLLDSQPTQAGIDPRVFGFLGGLLALVIFALILRAVLGSAQRRRRTLAEGERESLLDWKAVLASLRRQSPAAVRPPDPLDALARLAAYRHTVRVRRAYRAALARAEARHLTRLPAQTADEVLPALEGVFPTARAPLRTLTATYDRTRYTATPAGEADAAAAEAALQAIEAAAREGET